MNLTTTTQHKCDGTLQTHSVKHRLFYTTSFGSCLLTVLQSVKQSHRLISNEIENCYVKHKNTNVETSHIFVYFLYSRAWSLVKIHDHNTNYSLCSYVSIKISFIPNFNPSFNCINASTSDYEYLRPFDLF